jgi:hypothetical protein
VFLENEEMNTGMSLDGARDLMKVISFDPQNGVFRWLVSPAANVRAGDVAGQTNPKGYRVIRYKRRDYAAHRLAFLFVYGECPSIIDHIDRNPRNNAISNLRAATPSQSSANRSYWGNMTGYLGVRRDNKRKMYRAYISENGRIKYLGYFKTAQEAAIARDAAALKKWGSFASLNREIGLLGHGGVRA